MDKKKLYVLILTRKITNQPLVIDYKTNVFDAKEDALADMYASISRLKSIGDTKYNGLVTVSDKTTLISITDRYGQEHKFKFQIEEIELE